MNYLDILRCVGYDFNDAFEFPPTLKSVSMSQAPISSSLPKYTIFSDVSIDVRDEFKYSMVRYTSML